MLYVGKLYIQCVYLFRVFLHVGVAMRECLENGTWGPSIVTGCRSRVFTVTEKEVSLHAHKHNGTTLLIFIVK